MSVVTPDFTAIKAAQRAGWETGDYPRVGNTLQIIAERLVESVDLRAGQQVLDVACGQGNAALAAARRFAVASGVDYAPSLLAQGRERASAEHLEVTFIDGDAEQLPLDDRSVDVTLSTVGVMFAPNHRRAAAELVRVTRVGGKIGLASWTPSGMVGQLFKVVASAAPPPAGIQPATMWGSADYLAELFGDRVEWIGVREREYVFRYLSPDHFAQWFMEFYGPMTRLAATLDAGARQQFAEQLADVARTFNHADDGTVAADARYLETVGVRRS